MVNIELLLEVESGKLTGWHDDDGIGASVGGHISLDDVVIYQAEAQTSLQLDIDIEGKPGVKPGWEGRELLHGRGVDTGGAQKLAVRDERVVLTATEDQGSLSLFLDHNGSVARVEAQIAHDSIPFPSGRGHGGSRSRADLEIEAGTRGADAGCNAG